MINKPKVVCLCGSTRFKNVWERVNLAESLHGNIVLSVACFPHSDSVPITYKEKDFLDELHLRKIDLSDEILVLDVRGYIGESTQREIEYATRLGKTIRYLSKEEMPMSDSR